PTHLHSFPTRRSSDLFPSTHFVIKQANLFDLDLHKDLQWSTTGPLLVVGNPPWVTNSELGLLGSNNLPHKKNLKGLRGIEARTRSEEHTSELQSLAYL